MTAALAGCSGAKAPDRGLTDAVAPDFATEARRSERSAAESGALSNLAALERSLRDFVAAEKRLPRKLDELVPKYLGEIPPVTLGLGEHRDSDSVRYYGVEAIVSGRIDGRMIKDSGSWGYAFNGRQVILFIDCTHKAASGEPWYRARGLH